MITRAEILVEMLAQGFRRDIIGKFQTDKIVVCVSAKVLVATPLKEAVTGCLKEAREQGIVW
ncbi:MAG: hypothetical protein IIB43_00940 [Candidatus Marinimicrobia bacterium]|nr:hypothetical protein [Candidatus Neomarinimicrobiota bacterium]